MNSANHNRNKKKTWRMIRLMIRTDFHFQQYSVYWFDQMVVCVCVCNISMLPLFEHFSFIYLLFLSQFFSFCFSAVFPFYVAVTVQLWPSQRARIMKCKYSRTAEIGIRSNNSNEQVEKITGLKKNWERKNNNNIKYREKKTT